ncbi:hypothetical protein LguiB_024250 [Lonicera macranthoides]
MGTLPQTNRRFGFGILLLELITGQRALEFGKARNQKGAMFDWVKKFHQEKKLDVLVDKDLKNSYDRIELKEMVRVALLCTQYLLSHRPKMSEVVPNTVVVIEVVEEEVKDNDDGDDEEEKIEVEDEVRDNDDDGDEEISAAAVMVVVEEDVRNNDDDDDKEKKRVNDVR